MDGLVTTADIVLYANSNATSLQRQFTQILSKITVDTDPAQTWVVQRPIRNHNSPWESTGSPSKSHQLNGHPIHFNPGSTELWHWAKYSTVPFLQCPQSKLSSSFIARTVSSLCPLPLPCCLLARLSLVWFGRKMFPLLLLLYEGSLFSPDCIRELSEFPGEISLQCIFSPFA